MSFTLAVLNEIAFHGAVIAGKDMLAHVQEPEGQQLAQQVVAQSEEGPVDALIKNTIGAGLEHQTNKIGNALSGKADMGAMLLGSGFQRPSIVGGMSSHTGGLTGFGGVSAPAHFVPPPSPSIMGMFAA